jgi:hypothetical protein
MTIMCNDSCGDRALKPDEKRRWIVAGVALAIFVIGVSILVTLAALAQSARQ